MPNRISYLSQQNHSQSFSCGDKEQFIFLDQFKIKNILKNQSTLQQQYLNQNSILSQRFKNQHQNVYTLATQKSYLRQFFINPYTSKDKLEQKTQRKSRSKNRSSSLRSIKSPLHKKIKTQSRQYLNDPIQRAYKVIQQEQKTKQSNKLHQKTMRILNVIPTSSQLNESHINFHQKINQSKSVGNLNQLKSLSNKNLHQNQEHRNHFQSQRNQQVQASRSKIRNYFTKKQESQIRHQKMKNLLDKIVTRPYEQRNLQNKKSFSGNSQYSLSQSSQSHLKNGIQNQSSGQNDIEIQPYEYSSSNQSQQSQMTSNHKISQVNIQQNQIKKEILNKTPQRSNEQIHLTFKNIKMYSIDNKQKEDNHNFLSIPQQRSQSNNYRNSHPSIEEYIQSKSASFYETQQLSSKKQVHIQTHNREKQNNQIKEVERDQKSIMIISGQIKVTPKLSSMKDHEFSQFQVKKQSEKYFDKKDKRQNQLYQSDLGLKSKKSIFNAGNDHQKRNQIQKVSSTSSKELQKSYKNENESIKKQSPKTIKFLKVGSKKNTEPNHSKNSSEFISQNKSNESSINNSNLQNSQRKKGSQKSLMKQNSSKNEQIKKTLSKMIDSKHINDSYQSYTSRKSIKGSQKQKNSQNSRINSSNLKKQNKSSQTQQQEEQSGSSYSSSNSYSRSESDSLTKSLSQALSPNNFSKSSIPNSNLNLHLNSKESHSQSMIESSYNNNSSQTSLSNSISNNILRHSSQRINNNESSIFKKIKKQPQISLNDVARLVEEHEFRIQAYCAYVDNSKSIYEQDYQLQKVQFLSFLMLKKSVYQLQRAINALNGQGENVFNLTDIQIQDQFLEDYRQREQIREQRDNMVKSRRENLQKVKEMFFILEKKYLGERGFNMDLERDDMSKEMVKKLSQQLNVLYQKWQRNKSNDIELPKITKNLQRRMKEIIELIFLTSQLDGEKVKSCELFSDIQSQFDFRVYYERWFQKIIQTIEYFDKKKSTNLQ